VRTIRGADTTDWDRQDLDEYRQRLRTLSIEDRLQQAIAWSAALLADGQHARVDGWTSLAVLLGALGSLLGWPLADPIIGILITLVILFIIRDSAVTIWHRLMDAVEPQQVEAIEREARAIAGVEDVHEVRLRWMGHTLSTELHITVNEDLSTWESHEIAEQVRHALTAYQANLATVMVHVDPCGHGGKDPHASLPPGLRRTGAYRSHL